MQYLPDGTVIPNLIEQVPTVENGLLKEDLTGFTATINEGIVWSDGTPLTAADVVFTHQWITTPENGSVSIATWEPIQSITAVDERTFEVAYAGGNLNWYAPFTGTTYGPILPKHILEAGADAATAFNQGPIGTGPYIVTTFSPNDQVIYEANPNYRDPNKPFFQTVNLKGGGDRGFGGARRAADGRLGLRLEPPGRARHPQRADGDGQSKGTVQFRRAPTSSGSISTSPIRTPRSTGSARTRTPRTRSCPIWPSARRWRLAVDRETISTQFYGEGEPADANIVNGLPSFISPNTCLRVQPRQGEGDAGGGGLGAGRRRPRQGRGRAEDHLLHLDQPGAPEDPGRQQAELRGDRHPGLPPAGRLRHLLRLLAGE